MKNTYRGAEADLVGQEFEQHGADASRGPWGYLIPSGRPAVKCGKCGEIILETYGPEKSDGDQDLTTTHGCWPIPAPLPTSEIEG